MNSFRIYTSLSGLRKHKALRVIELMKNTATEVGCSLAVLTVLPVSTENIASMVSVQINLCLAITQEYQWSGLITAPRNGIEWNDCRQFKYKERLFIQRESSEEIIGALCHERPKHIRMEYFFKVNEFSRWRVPVVGWERNKF